jgi:hypothetical protein
MAGSFIAFPAGTSMSAGQSGYYYDRAVARFLPVPRSAISPDGLRYAYTEGWLANPPTATRVHVVDARTGADLRSVAMPDTQPYFVIDFTSSGIDLGIGFEGRGQGVWKMDPNTGVVAKVSDGLYPPDAQWFGVVDAKDPQPYRSAISGMPGENRIDHRDAAGQTTTWFYRPGFELAWVAFIGTPALLVLAHSHDLTVPVDNFEYWLAVGVGQATELAAYGSQQSSPYSGLYDGFRSAIADSHGIWIGGGSLFLVGRSGNVQRVYGQAVSPANGCS